MPKREKFLLLVEDDPDDVEIARAAFGKSGAGAEIVVLEDGQQAVDFLAARGKFAGRDATHLPCAVLLDLKLPKLSGLEVLRSIRAEENTKFVPVIVLTTSNEEGDIRRAYTLGANAYVKKACEFAAFASAMGSFAHFWIRCNESPAASAGLG